MSFTERTQPDKIAYQIAAVLDGDYDDGLEVAWSVSSDAEVVSVTLTDVDTMEAREFEFTVEEVFNAD